jgi:glyoxylase-like metal-dependent hydrolase (beta-lactamase superfamily II)
MTKTVPTQQVPALYRCRVGDAVVTAVSDGGIKLDPAMLQNITQDESKVLLAAAGRPDDLLTAINTYLVQTPDRTLLIDSGSGALIGPTAGFLLANLAAAGVAPEEVDAVLMTHLHIDHVGGLLTAEGKPVFVNAELLVSQAEAAYWLDEATAAAAPEAARGAFDLAKRMITPYGDRLHRFSEGEPVPGIEAVPLPGHTPGHTGYALGSGADRLLIWGDIFHLPDIQSRRPEAGVPFDTDPEMAIATRRRVLARAANERLLVAGMHLHFPGFMRVLAEGSGYAVQPVAWQPL